MTKNTESLIFACHELARVASCDDYLILNEIADRLESLRKDRESYKEMFVESCLGLGAIANAVGIKAEDDSGSPSQVIDKIESIILQSRIDGIKHARNRLIAAYLAGFIDKQESEVRDIATMIDSSAASIQLEVTEDWLTDDFGNEWLMSEINNE
ncbi:hypothetical protein Ppb6_01237 [Photorhabdus australis subsp. thailandensis]|uniref:Uncharacterized protein n=1 Tax=Photorhabdus australis subsp. thailandensis TaxID=2805096 RepID=A0A1C0U6S9_9GAMM|nr:hypothetical protein [Photorhabdus australis]OCQ53611.1 hypothetical protein Ppb6_01237 [Photorhabdus australis subsp. thailandensis]